jgi:sporulation related protein
MYDTRWPRPGPAMAVIAAVLGLVAGALLGLASPGARPQAEASPPVETTAGPTTTTLPDEFHTVILGSYNDRANAEERLREVRNQGVRDAALLDQEEFDLGTRWAVYSGRYDTREQAEAHEQELSGLGVTPSFYKHVTRTT